jgi:hypothetical protein
VGVGLVFAWAVEAEEEVRVADGDTSTKEPVAVAATRAFTGRETSTEGVVATVATPALTDGKGSTEEACAPAITGESERGVLESADAVGAGSLGLGR